MNKHSAKVKNPRQEALEKSVTLLTLAYMYLLGVVVLLCLERSYNYASGAHVQARYTVVCCVSVCVYIECYSCSRINEVQVRVSIGF